MKDVTVHVTDMQGEQHTLVCHNQEPGHKMQIRIEVNLHAGQRVFML